MIKNPYGEGYKNPRALELVRWAESLDDMIKAKKIIKVADRMEVKYINFYFSIRI